MPRTPRPPFQPPADRNDPPNPVQYEVVDTTKMTTADWKVLNNLVMTGKLKLISWQD